jgi:hypothetical protein
LIPTLNAIHIRRQNEAWYSATFILQDGKELDLIRNFSQINIITALDQAKLIWDVPESMNQRHTCGTKTYNSRLFALFLTNSITPSFASLLHSRIDPKYCNDGPLLLLTMCLHIHRNHLAFVESVKNKIRLSSLTEFKDDIETYLRFLQDNLCLITSTGTADTDHNDLIPHILLQLRTTKIPIFQHTVLKWHRQYSESKLKLAPSVLVTVADEECQVLKHANQWVETINPSVVAMKAMLQTHQSGAVDVFKTIAAHFTEMNSKQQRILQDVNHQPGKDRNLDHVTPAYSR